MDRNFKLRQMFSDYLEMKAKESTTPPLTPLAELNISGMSEDDKKKATIRKITEEEMEVFEVPDKYCPVYFADDSYELKWIKDKLANPPTLTIASEEEHAKLSVRLLQLLVKTELLESNIFKYDDVRMIRVYFMDEREKPTEKLVAILDNVLTVAMSKLVAYSDKITVAVDYEIRAFMVEAAKARESCRYFNESRIFQAKRLVLETMLKYPEYVPDSWGGEAAMQRWKEVKEADIRRGDADERDREKAEETERKEKEEKVKKDERIRKEVEEAERKKKEEKEKRKKEKETAKKDDMFKEVVTMKKKGSERKKLPKEQKDLSLKADGAKKTFDPVKNSDVRNTKKNSGKKVKKSANDMKSREPTDSPAVASPATMLSPAQPSPTTGLAAPKKSSTAVIGVPKKNKAMSKEGGGAPNGLVVKVFRSVSRMTKKKEKE